VEGVLDRGNGVGGREQTRDVGLCELERQARSLGGFGVDPDGVARALRRRYAAGAAYGCGRQVGSLPINVRCSDTCPSAFVGS
jgi:hypothetical protein